MTDEGKQTYACNADGTFNDCYTWEVNHSGFTVYSECCADTIRDTDGLRRLRDALTAFIDYQEPRP